MMRIAVLANLVFIILGGCNAQSTNKGNDSLANGEKRIQWMSFTEAVEKNKTAPRKIFIDVYTEWCGWCKKMDKTTFVDSNVVNYMSQYFYAVKMDAESRDSVNFGDHTFTYLPDQKANELAISLLNGKMSYPTFVIMDENIKLLSPVAGYQTAPQIMPILKYFGDNIYLKQNWEEYSKTK
nr:DUF255 domain-containing protein [Bacteroidota bacterium]